MTAFWGLPFLLLFNSFFCSPLQDEQIPSTIIKWNNTSVCFHDFKGIYPYITDEQSIIYFNFKELKLDKDVEMLDSINENTQKSYELFNFKIPIDTFFLGEDIDMRLDSKWIEFSKPKKGEKYELSMAYLYSINEVFDYRIFPNANYDSTIRFFGHIDYFKLEDSAGRFFQVGSHTPDMVRVDVVNGEIVSLEPPKSEDDILWEYEYDSTQFTKIKNQYGFSDTNLVIPGEYSTFVSLTKNGKLFTYNYDSFIFKFQKFKGKKCIETKFFVVWIHYGC